MDRMKYTARPASDNSNDWPIWMIWDGHLNVTGRVMRAMYYPWLHGAVFLTRYGAQRYAALANERGVKL